jgi:hypothetical protein
LLLRWRLLILRHRAGRTTNAHRERKDRKRYPLQQRGFARAVSANV